MISAAEHQCLRNKLGKAEDTQLFITKKRYLLRICKIFSIKKKKKKKLIWHGIVENCEFLLLLWKSCKICSARSFSCSSLRDFGFDSRQSNITKRGTWSSEENLWNRSFLMSMVLRIIIFEYTETFCKPSEQWHK